MKPEHAWILARLTEYLKEHRDINFGEALVQLGITSLSDAEYDNVVSDTDEDIIKRIKQSL